MVAVIKTGHSIHRILNYNEQKVKEGVAQCIWAANYPKDVDDLSFENKLNRLLKQAALNENVSRNSVHISLNFDPSEQLSPGQLAEISTAYMQKIGFGEQPHLVYQHLDAGHPHVHLVSIKIRRDGSRIETQNIGRNQSLKARNEIEQAYGLKRAEEGKQRQVNRLRPEQVERVQYGKKETRSSVSSVVDYVVDRYQYTSLDELNAVLRQFGVVADRGSEHSRIHQHKGLVYRVLDERGNKKGVPIKASSCESKPTLKLLEVRFKQNEKTREQHALRIRNAIDWTLLKEQQHTFQSFQKSLQKIGIAVVIKHGPNGAMQDIIYVDHGTKTVFGGHDLGHRYSVAMIQIRFRQEEKLVQNGLGQRIKRGEKIAKKKEQAIEKGEVLTSKMNGAATSLKQSAPGDNPAQHQHQTVKKNQNRISRHL